MTLTRPQPLYLCGESETVFAWFHDALEHRAGTAVLICPPFGLDAMSPYRSRRSWAEHLAAGGYPTLRIDLPGSGDSPGGPRDPGQLEAWTEAVSVAARWLRSTAGTPRIVAMGVGLGGLVAYRAASLGPCVDDFVLWGVPARGRTLVRELRSYARLPSATVSPPHGHISSPLPEGAVMAAGHLLSGETASALEAIDLTASPLANMGQRRILLVGRSGPRVDPQLRRSLEQAGAEVTVTSGPGYGERGEFFARVDSWLHAGNSNGHRANPPVATPRERSSTAAGEPSVCEHLTLSHAGVPLRETPVWIDRPQERLFGVLAEPLHEPRNLSAVLLTTGAYRHTGPSRLWVTVARQWAAKGVPTLRFDMSGIGDSDGQSNPREGLTVCDDMPMGDSEYLEAPLSAPEYLDATSAALDMLESRGLPNRFVLVGLCSGAYWALQVALRDKRVAAAIMVNPPTLIWNEQVGDAHRRVARRRFARALRSRLLLGATWRKLIAGEIPAARCLSLAWMHGVRPALDACRQVLPGQRGQEVAAGAQGAALLDALRDRGQTAFLMLTGDDEPVREEFVRSGFLDDLDRWPNLEVELMSGAKQAHSLTPLWVQQHVLASVERVLDRELESGPAEEAAYADVYGRCP